MLFSLLQPLRDIPLAVVDVETTGVSAEFGDRVIEVGIARMERGRVVAEYQQLVDPQRRIGAGVTALTGITQSMVAGQPRFRDQILGMMPLLVGAAIVGHNVRFDLSFLHSEFRKAGQHLPDVLGDVPVLDTVRIARKRFGRGGNSLGLLSGRLGIEPVAAHRALADAMTTAAVFERLMDPVGGWNCPLCDAIQCQGGPMHLLSRTAQERVLPLELEEALELQRPVRMEYLDVNDRRTHRVIQPIQIRRFDDELLLVAHCHLRNAQRTFKLDRIVHLERIEPESNNKLA